MTYINPLYRLWVGTASSNNPEGAIIRAGGKHTNKTITLSASATSANVNVFQLTGTVDITGLHGEIVTATTLTNCTSVYFDLWDGTTSVPITKTTGAALSGFNVGGFFIKDADVASSLTTQNNDQCRIKEAATGARVQAEFIATQKTGTNTYIRFNYTTTDAPIAATVKVDIVWRDIDAGSITAV